MRRRKKTKAAIVIDEATVHIIPASDVAVLSLGWLFSLHGFMFVIFCSLGSWTGFFEIYRSLNNDPITITVGDRGGASTGRNVKIFGAIEPDIQVIGKRRYSAEPFTLTLLRGSEHAVVIYSPALIPDQALHHPIERWYEGELTVLGRGEERVDGNRISVKSMFRDLAIELPADAIVVADSVIPIFRWWFVVIFGVCALGLFYIVNRVLWTVVFLGNRDALYRYLSRPRRRIARVNEPLE